MSIQLASDEKILRSYDYAESKAKGLGATKGSKTLVITNKRIIHKEKIEGKKSSGSNTSEMPISAAKYVRTNFKETRYPILLVLGILFALVAFIVLIASGKSGDAATAGAAASATAKAASTAASNANGGGNAAIVPFLILLAIAAVCIIVYLKKKTYTFACSIDTDTHITNAFGFSSVSGDSRTAGLFAMFRKANNNFYIKVKVNAEVAQQMADEMGYIIAAAANGDFDEVEAPCEAAE